MSDFAHLDALELRLSNERGYLRDAKTESEKALRRVWIQQIEKEIADERGFIGLPVEMDDSSLLEELFK